MFSDWDMSGMQMSAVVDVLGFPIAWESTSAAVGLSSSVERSPCWQSGMPHGLREHQSERLCVRMDFYALACFRDIACSGLATSGIDDFNVLLQVRYVQFAADGHWDYSVFVRTGLTSRSWLHSGRVAVILATAMLVKVVSFDIGWSPCLCSLFQWRGCIGPILMKTFQSHSNQDAVDSRLTCNARESLKPTTNAMPRVDLLCHHRARIEALHFAKWRVSITPYARFCLRGQRGTELLSIIMFSWSIELWCLARASDANRTPGLIPRSRMALTSPSVKNGL